MPEGDKRAESRDAVPSSNPTTTRTAGDAADLTRAVTIDRDMYALGAEIARGGMGRIVAARDRRLGREVAIKEVLRRDPRVERRFEREIRITARLQHPAIINVLEAGVWPTGEPFYVMKKVEGRSLDAAIDATRSIRERLGLLSHVSAVADALAYAHSRRVIHRDLKPANVLVGAFGETVVIDWGLAKDLTETNASGDDHADWIGDQDSDRSGAPSAGDATASVAPDDVPSGIDDRAGLTRAGSAIGTPAYMPPEQACGDTVDERADVYALGAMLYHVLGGQAPYADEGSAAAVIAAVTRRSPRPLRSLEPDLPRDLVTIVEKAMAREPGDRYENAGTLAHDLKRFETGQLVRAHEYSAAALVRRWMRRNRGIVATAGVAVVIALVGAGLFLVRERGLRRDAEDNRRAASDRLADIRRLSDVQLLRQYTADADALWPVHPDMVIRLEGWLDLARALAARLPQHEAHLSQLRAQAQRRDAERFGFDDPRLQWEHDTLADLVAGLREFSIGDSPGSIGEVSRRLEMSRTIRARTIDSYSTAWQTAIAAIGDSHASPWYRGLQLAPQIGLVPLGPDPASRLWEFADAQTGDIPVRAGDGTLIASTTSAVVFVLVPGGRFRMGAVPASVGAETNVDPAAQTDEAPTHEVELAAFLIAKHEMTQAQWLRATGSNPSQYRAGESVGDRLITLMNPVESVSWNDCRDLFRHLAFVLPTEAQWEYAARAGSSLPYWSGADRESLAGAANLADRWARDHGGQPGLNYQDWLDDGWTAHAPVGSYRANGFGLHDTCGNVWEWARDAYGSYDLPVSPQDGERRVEDELRRVLRGGGWRGPAEECRSAFRGRDSPGTRLVGLGVRPARLLAQ